MIIKLFIYRIIFSQTYFTLIIITQLYSSLEMTTAHRPTWKAAYGLSDSVGKGYIPTRSYSARDQPSYLKLKERQWGQGSVQQLKQKDFKAELLKRQAEAKNKKNGLIQIVQEDFDAGKRQRVEEVDFISSYQPETRKKIRKPQQQQQGDNDEQKQQINPFPEDQDSEQFVREEQQDKKKKRIASDDQDDEDEDDSEELLREYQKIKQQREKQEFHKREQKHKQSLANREAELLKGNPLIDSSYSISKRWYEDTVFRNQAKKVDEKKQFINDYVRSDFHRKFMNRYVMR